MKKYCILEQGDKVGEDITLKKKSMFSTDFSDFYRLNWKKEDPNAYIEEKNITWSEGRSLLYDRVPKKYEYYIFIDDDVVFDSKKEAPEEIRRLLSKYNPINATLYNSNSWSYEFLNREKKRNIKRGAFPIAGFDLQAHIVKSTFADICFPAIYHGAEKSLWYPQWFCHVLKPLKQMCFTTVRVSNLRSKGQEFSHKSTQYSSASKIMWLINKHAKSDRKFKMQKDILEASSEVFNKKPSKCECNIDYKDIKSIYEMNYDFEMRTPKSGVCYKVRNILNDLIWKISKNK